MSTQGKCDFCLQMADLSGVCCVCHTDDLKELVQWRVSFSNLKQELMDIMEYNEPDTVYHEMKELLIGLSMYEPDQKKEWTP